MNGVNVSVDLSKNVILGGKKKRTLYVILSVMPDGSVVPVGSRELVFDLDVSPSMEGRCKSGLSAISETKSATIEAIHMMPDTDLVSVYTFSTVDRQPVLTTSLSLMRAIAVQEVNGLQTSGGTRLGPALRRAVKKKGNNIRRAVVLTDGDANDKVGDLIECKAAVSDVDACPVWMFAIGPDYNEAQLKAIVAAAKPGSFLRHVEDASEILKEFQEQIAVLQGTGGVSNVVLTFVSDPGFRILSAARLVPDQADVPVTDADTKVSFLHGDLDSVYGQQLVLEIEVSADTLGYGNFMVGNFLVSFDTPTGSQKEYGEVWVEITQDESLSAPINSKVMNTALTVRGTRLATLGNLAEAKTLLTAAGHQGVAKRLSTIGSGDSNDSRALRTTLGTISKKTISSSGGN